MPYVEIPQLEEKEVVPGFRGKFVHTENMTVVYWTVTAGSALAEHKHPHEQVASLISGELEFTLDGETRIITPDTAVTIPSNVLHSGKALTDCKIIDIFYPVREDYK